MLSDSAREYPRLHLDLGPRDSSTSALCSMHALIFISTVTVYADKADDNSAYRKISRSTFAKCQTLWNK